MALTVAENQRIERLENLVENMASKWGYFYTKDGTKLDFYITRLYEDGSADGIILHPGSSLAAQGEFGVPMKHEKGEQHWEPLIVPKKAQAELFGAPVEQEQEGEPSERRSATVTRS